MRLIIDIPEQWRDDMVWEKFDKLDELCKVILDSDIIPDNVTVCDIEQIRAEIDTRFKEARVQNTRFYYDVLEIIDKYTKGKANDTR